MLYVVNYEVSIGVPDLLSGITGTSSISIRLTPVSRTRFFQQINQPILGSLGKPEMDTKCLYTWWLIPVSKWIITPVISELTLLSPVITRGITYLSGGEPPSRPFLDVFPLGSSARRRRAEEAGRDLPGWREPVLHRCLESKRDFAMGNWRFLGYNIIYNMYVYIYSLSVLSLSSIISYYCYHHCCCSCCIYIYTLH